MDWRMLIRRCPSRSFTIVGDVAQTSALGGTRRWSKSMNRLFGESHWDLNELTIKRNRRSFRTFLPFARRKASTSPRTVRCAPSRFGVPQCGASM